MRSKEALRTSVLIIALFAKANVIGALLSPAWLQAAALLLSPLPRSVEPGAGKLTVVKTLRVRLAPDTSATRFAVGTLGAETARGHVALEPTRKPSGLHLLAGLMSDPGIAAEAGGAKPDKPQSYLLRITSKGILVAGADDAGLFYGIQTLRQLARPSGTTVTFPLIAIQDAPALPYRGLSVDISRGPILTEDQLKSLIQTLSEFKMNMLTLYMEHVFPYRHAPLVAPKDTGITPEMLKRLSDYAARYYVDVVPQQQTFGHLHNMLKLEMYAGMAETPHGSVLAAEDERAYQWIAGAARELAAVFRSPFLHIGSDETFELGSGRSRELATRIGTGDVYMLHMRRVSEMLAPLNKKLMFWGDIALSHPELMPKLPKNLIAMTWDYDPKPSYAARIAPFRENGMEVFVCPGLSNWFRIYPDIGPALQNINQFVKDGKEGGAAGMLNTHWVDEGEGLFNLNWYAIVFSASSAWQQGPVDLGAFERAFDWTFHRREDEAVAEVIQRFARANRLLRDAGLKYASDRLFWMDPFTRAGARSVALALPAASEIRKLAEQNLVDLEAIERTTPVRSDTFRFLYLAARRLDYLGMKVQFSRYIADRYRAALAVKADQRSAGLNLRRITSTNGYVEDLREAILKIKALYRNAWLAENEPYWIENVLVKYDAEALYWQQKSSLISRVLQEYLATGDLPLPEQLGLVLSPESATPAR